MEQKSNRIWPTKTFAKRLVEHRKVVGEGGLVRMDRDEVGCGFDDLRLISNSGRYFHI